MTERTPFILGLLVVATIISSNIESALATTPVMADEILSLARDGQPVYYEDIYIKGDLNLSSLPEMMVKSPFVIINSTIPDASLDGIVFRDDAIFWGTMFGNCSSNGSSFSQADFSDTSFGRSNFRGTNFGSTLSFDRALFRDDVSFIDSVFAKDADFSGAQFLGDADFNYTSFGYYTYFPQARFLKNASFSDVDFKGALDFGGADFKGTANFFQSGFGDAAGFDDTSFVGPVSFGLTRFSGLSSFGNATFYREASFNLARFGDAAYFSQARFKGDALFGLVKFEDIASFQGASFEGRLNLKAARISTLLMENALLGGGCRMIINDSEFMRLKAPWNDVKDHLVYDPGAFLALVENYHGLGWSHDEDDCYYEYRWINQNQRGWGWMKLLDMTAWLSCGYGVRPGYAVLWSLLTIVVFALIFWAGDGIRRSARPFQGAESDPVPERATVRNALFFSTMIFLSQGPIDFLPVGRHRYYVIIEGILGWLLLALFLVTLGKVMIR